jgi:hypothetical protein
LAGRDDRHNAVAGEQISQTGLHQLQRHLEIHCSLPSAVLNDQPHMGGACGVAESASNKVA